jgi:hypothetical protein
MGDYQKFVKHIDYLLRIAAEKSGSISKQNRDNRGSDLSINSSNNRK